MRFEYLNARDCSGLFEDYLREALALLRANDYSQMAPGRYEVNDHLYFMIQKYTTKAQAEALYEAHRRYADLQYVVSGEEAMWVCKTCDMSALSDFDVEKDMGKYQEAKPLAALRLLPGSYAVFMPEDCHKTSFTPDGEPRSEVVKVVFKIRIP
jgi:YhcH/YjgK/YiaL family protein